MWVDNVVPMQRMNPETGDLVLKFSGDVKVEVFNFTGYEVWDLRFPDGSCEFSTFALE